MSLLPDDSEDPSCPVSVPPPPPPWSPSPPSPSSGARAPARPTAPTGRRPTPPPDRFPVTIEHAYGETTIEAQPERIATVAWANHEVPLALGVVPVGMSKATWGDDDGDGVLPWVEDALDELGAETPVLFDETDGIDFEAVADTEPDVILAAYSGLTQEEYDTLSKIAPVDRLPGRGVGHVLRGHDPPELGRDRPRPTRATSSSTTSTPRSTRRSRTTPSSPTRSVLFSYIDPADFSQIGFYTSHDTRPGFLASLGLPLPAVVEEESAGTDEFYVTISAEEADRFADVDVFVTYGEADGAIVEQLQADPLLSQIPAIANGKIAILESSTPLAASANPSPLSIGWGIDEYFALLASALG